MAGDPRSSEAAERYASALFDLAQDAKAIDAVARDAEALSSLLSASEDLRRLAESPAFSAEDKQAGLVAIAERASVHTLLRRFLGVLAQNRRARELGPILLAFAALVAEHRGVTTAEVAAARPLTPAQQKALAAALKSVVGRDVEMRVEVKPEILGGLVVQVGSRMFDSSLKTKLDGLKAAMKGA
jgi:F-type H+-transporting ATPase subunit delta